MELTCFDEYTPFTDTEYMGMQDRTKRRIFREVCHAEREAEYQHKSIGESYSESVLAARYAITKKNSISLMTLTGIINLGIHHDWPEGDEESSIIGGIDHAPQEASD